MDLPFSEFWAKTPRFIIHIINVKNKSRVARSDEVRARNHELAHLIGAAFHDPKHIPKFKPSAQAQPRQEAPADLPESLIKDWFRKAASKNK